MLVYPLMALTVHSIKSTALTVDGKAPDVLSSTLPLTCLMPTELRALCPPQSLNPPSLFHLFLHAIPCLPEMLASNPKEACLPSLFWSQISIFEKAFTEFATRLSPLFHDILSFVPF